MQRYASRHRVLPPSMRVRGFPVPYHDRFLTHPQWSPIWTTVIVFALLLLVVIVAMR